MSARPRRTDPDHLMALGDRLLARGWTCLASRAFQRAADALLAEPLYAKAQRQLSADPLGALATLARIERLVGASPAARALAAQAYDALGEPTVAARFRAAV